MKEAGPFWASQASSLQGFYVHLWSGELVQQSRAFAFSVFEKKLSVFSTSGVCLGASHRPLSSSFLGLPHRILNINHKKELLMGPMGS